jgi:signal transduction histidine kinase
LDESGQDNDFRINKILACLGVVSGATMAIYQRLRDGVFENSSQWQVPEGLDINSEPFQKLVQSAIENKGSGPYWIIKLPESADQQGSTVNPIYSYRQYIGYCVYNSTEISSVLSLFFTNFTDLDIREHLLIKLLIRNLSCEEKCTGLEFQNDELIRSNKEKDNFYSIIAHDLKSPFNGFLGLTYLLTDELVNLNSEELLEITSTLRKSANNMYALLENLLEWSRIQRGVIKFDPQPLSLLELIYKTIQVVADPAQKKQISINPNISELIIVNSDPHMTLTILKNLVTNGIKYSNQGGEVQIYTLRRSDYMIEIIVRDTGTGISEEIAKNLFNMNELVKKPGTDGESGSGLGLIICKNYIEKHQGSIWFETNFEGGISVHFTLPLAAQSF